MKKRILKIASGLFIFAILFTAFMGFAHTRAGRPVLAYLGKLMGKSQVCPLGFDRQLSLDQRERVRKAEAARRVNLPSARERSAFNFTIGESTRNQVSQWVQTQGGHCKAQKTSYEMECNGPFFAAGSSTLWIEFDASDRLVGLRGIERFKTPTPALALFTQAEKQIKKQGAKNLEQSGDPSSAFLKSGLLAQVSIRSDFNHYRAILRVTNMGDNFAVTHDFTGY